MVGRADSPTGILYADVTVTQSKVKVKVTGLLNFRQLAKPCMLAAMTAARFRDFWLTCFAGHFSSLSFLLIADSNTATCRADSVNMLVDKFDLYTSDDE